VSCFDTKLEQDLFRAQNRGFSVNLPVNVTDENLDSVQKDLEIQLSSILAAYRGLAPKCVERTGQEIAFVGESLLCWSDY
jgi:hypothetical protein